MSRGGLSVAYGFRSSGFWREGGEETRAVSASLTEVLVETKHWFGWGKVVRGVDEECRPFTFMSGAGVGEEGWMANGAKPDVRVETPRCEGVVTPNEGGAVGVVWAEEPPEVGALPDGTD